jgi:hypothetical protein
VNLLDLVPAFRRQLRQFSQEQDTDSHLAAYLADAIDALNWRWARDYVVTFTSPNTYNVSPDVVAKDKRAIILMGSIIYKSGNTELASFKDGDFAYDPQQGRQNPLAVDISELDKMLPLANKRLGLASSVPLRGFSNGYNPESYSFLVYSGVVGAI